MNRLLINSLFFVLLALSDVAAAGDSQWRWSGVERIVAFGDVHGAYNELVDLLQKTAVIDADLNWIGGQTHLVSVGDLVDRGPESRKVMDLMMRLQEQSDAAGGRVHVLLGNHELMNLTGDLRYVSAGEYAAFANDEPASLRQAAFEKFMGDNNLAASPEARAEFDDIYPPGYFGLRAAFSPDGMYGRWILERPIMIVINRTAFTHGGLPPLVTSLGLAETNRRLRSELKRFVYTWQELLELDLVPAYVDAHNSESIIEETLTGMDVNDAGLIELARSFDEVAASDIFDDDGPLWYRGTALCHPLLETSVTASALTRIDADRVVIGHTPTSDRRVGLRFDERVVMLDTGMLKGYYKGVPSALTIENDELSITYGAGSPRLYAEASDAEIEQLLLEATVGQQDESQDTFVLQQDDQMLQAAFRSDRIGREYAYQAAAYRIDRMLGLGLVPVTVLRDIDGRSYALSLRNEVMMNEDERIESGVAVPDWCAAGDVYDLMYVLDALVGNEGRTRSTMLYTGPGMSLQLTGFGRTFGTSARIPDYLAPVSLRLTPELQQRLAALDFDTLRNELDGLVNKRQVRALLKRRDKILEEWSHTQEP